ncbi:hypothetical protein I4U23_022286 [Adineta vaga]|nr:hypothetical protein I4U23_022286 [Adineta vaga]
MFQMETFLLLLIILSTTGENSEISYNQPKFCPTATWYAHAITFANTNIVGQLPHAIFVNTNNTVYVAHQKKGYIIVWRNNNTTPAENISSNLTEPRAIFVSTNGNIFGANGENEVKQWTASTKVWTTAMSVRVACYGLFVDINNTLYCSLKFGHEIVKKWLNSSTSTVRIAGNGTAGSASNQINEPLGIFVDINYDLYVADCGNNRVQLFQSNHLIGITVAGLKSTTVTIDLNCPSGVVLDANKYLLITDQVNHRIVGSGPNGFRCLVGCNGGGSSSNQLSYPLTLAFDSFGNMFVSDIYNHRIQKFTLASNCFNEFTTLLKTISTTTIIKTVDQSTKLSPTIDPTTENSAVLQEKRMYSKLVISHCLAIPQSLSDK